MDEYDFIATIRKIAIEAVNTTRPASVIFGAVISVDPIKIKVDKGYVVDDDFLVKTEAAMDNLKTGEQVALLQIQGGQKFLILDKVVKA